MRKVSRMVARLYLDGQDVGEVAVRGWEGSWGFGDFQPGPSYERFSPLYGRWSSLMHQDDGRSRLSRGASQALRQLEGELAGIEAKLFFPADQQWRQVAMVNIDGPLIEWKERWSGAAGGPPASANRDLKANDRAHEPERSTT